MAPDTNLYAALRAAFPTDLDATAIETCDTPVPLYYTWRDIDHASARIANLLDSLELLRSATVVIVVAGMEGALPSVVAGLVAAPVIAVPTSVGYGAAFGGVAALLSMLNSCAPNVGVVNVDNGFGAAALASAEPSSRARMPRRRRRDG